MNLLDAIKVVDDHILEDCYLELFKLFTNLLQIILEIVAGYDRADDKMKTNYSKATQSAQVCLNIVILLVESPYFEMQMQKPTTPRANTAVNLLNKFDKAAAADTLSKKKVSMQSSSHGSISSAKAIQVVTEDVDDPFWGFPLAAVSSSTSQMSELYIADILNEEKLVLSKYAALQMLANLLKSFTLLFDARNGSDSNRTRLVALLAGLTCRICHRASAITTKKGAAADDYISFTLPAMRVLLIDSLEVVSASERIALLMTLESILFRMRLKKNYSIWLLLLK